MKPIRASDLCNGLYMYHLDPHMVLIAPSVATQKYGINAQVIPIVLIFSAFFIFHVFLLLVTFVLVLSTQDYLFSIMLKKCFSF